MANYNVEQCVEPGGERPRIFVVNIPFPVTGGDVVDFLIDGIRVCGVVVAETLEDPVDIYIALNVYNSCEECNNPPEPEPMPPRSANTEVFVCEICCDCGATGSTVNQITPPHPVWADGYGTQVTQLNMITLGGINGLNS